jgi:PAS domain S-box-containing protein
MASLRHDDVAVFLRHAGDTAKRLGTQVDQFSTRMRRQQAKTPSGVFPTTERSAPPDEPPVGAQDMALAAEELRVQQDQLELACELLERERAKYMDLFEHAPDAYVATDVAGSITNANIASGVLFGVQPGSLIGKPLISFVARQDTRAFRERLRELKESPDVCAMTVRMRPRGGDVFAVTLRMQAVLGLRGKPMAFRCTLRKADLSAAPVAWLEELGSVATLRDAPRDVVDLAEHLEHASNTVRAAAAARGVRVVLDSERRSWRVHSGVMRLRRLLEVLLSGAVAATTNYGELRVRVVVEGDSALLDATPNAELAGAPTVRVRLALLA